MKSGRAGRWAAREFEYEAKSESQNLRFLDWVDFEREFRKDFTPLNEEATAINAVQPSAELHHECLRVRVTRIVD